MRVTQRHSLVLQLFQLELLKYDCHQVRGPSRHGATQKTNYLHSDFQLLSHLQSKTVLEVSFVEALGIQQMSMIYTPSVN